MKPPGHSHAGPDGFEPGAHGPEVGPLVGVLVPAVVHAVQQVVLTLEQAGVRPEHHPAAARTHPLHNV